MLNKILSGFILSIFMMCSVSFAARADETDFNEKAKEFYSLPQWQQDNLRMHKLEYDSMNRNDQEIIKERLKYLNTHYSHEQIEALRHTWRNIRALPPKEFKRLQGNLRRFNHMTPQERLEFEKKYGIWKNKNHKQKDNAHERHDKP